MGWARSGGVEQRLSTRRSLRRRAGLQTQVREDLLDDWLLEDGGDDLQLAPAVRAVLEVQINATLEQSGRDDNG